MMTLTRVMSKSRQSYFILVLLILFYCNSVDSFLYCSPSVLIFRNNQQLQLTVTTNSNDDVNSNDGNREYSKQILLQVIEDIPSNAATSPQTTREILQIVEQLESACPTSNQEVLPKLSGNWELLWTAQDTSRKEAFFNYINPLENQSYSNNPTTTGRTNPFLPQPVQERLQDLGIVAPNTEPVRSSQTIDLKKQQVRNVVSFQIPVLSGINNNKNKKAEPRASLAVTVDFQPNVKDERRIDVKFQACRVVLQRSLDFTIPLGVIGPTGWLRTGYIDDTMRITRGHKGSVFVLTRPSAK
jgi:hypothetical protein